MTKKWLVALLSAVAMTFSAGAMAQGALSGGYVGLDVGQTVAASMQAPTLFVLAADLTKMQVMASLDESDIGRISAGQRVSFTVDAYPAETFTGSVAQVRLQPRRVQQGAVDRAVPGHGRHHGRPAGQGVGDGLDDEPLAPELGQPLPALRGADYGGGVVAEGPVGDHRADEERPHAGLVLGRPTRGATSMTANRNTTSGVAET